MRRRRAKRVIAAWALTAMALAAPVQGAAPPRRIVSLIPSVTEMIFAIGGGDRMVGVSNFDRFPPDVSRLMRVGGLLDPNVERILSLKPDLVVVYNTQVELKQRLVRLGIPYYSYEHRALADITVTIRSVGARIGLGARAEAVAREMERAIADLRAKTASLPRIRTMLVFGREPGSLRNIETSGGYGFLHDMLEAAGGVNIFGSIQRQSVQASTEMILARRPEVIIELRYEDSEKANGSPSELEAWNALPSLPAVKSRRLYVLTGDEFVVPGPRVGQAIAKLAKTLHPGSVP